MVVEEEEEEEVLGFQVNMPMLKRVYRYIRRREMYLLASIET